MSIKAVINLTGLSEDNQKELIEYFEPFELVAQDWAKRVKTFHILGEDDTEGVQKAKDALSIVKSKRIAVENKRKELKEYYLRAGQSIDKVAKTIAEMFAPIEEDLKAKADYIKNLQAERKAQLLTERQDQLTAIGMVGYNPAIADMDQETWEMFFEGAKNQIAKRKEQEEAERKAQEKAEKEEAKRLEAEKKQKELEYKAAKKLAEENKKKAQEESEARKKAEAENEALKQRLSEITNKPIVITKTLHTEQEIKQILENWKFPEIRTIDADIRSKVNKAKQEFESLKESLLKNI
ncbi:MAG: hypothetical protein E6Q36_01170 [Chryseobacterium sp.]|nr:MAG: hypothetical protein E6Q36_01170 [Chryseobacterium sp.]